MIALDFSDCLWQIRLGLQDFRKFVLLRIEKLLHPLEEVISHSVVNFILGLTVTDGKHTLEKKFEEEVNRPPVRQREVSEILQDIKNHEGMLRLFHLLKQTNNFNTLLFLHPLDLFGREGRYRPPHLFHGNCPEKKEGESYISRTLRALEIDYQAQASLGMNKIFEQMVFQFSIVLHNIRLI